MLFACKAKRFMASMVATPQDPKFWVFIPARRKSTRFPNKVMAPILGKPMVVHVYERVVQAVSESQHVFILADDLENFAALEKFTSQVLMTSLHCRNGSERCLDAASRLDVAAEDVILNIQADEPLISHSHIHALQDPFKRGLLSGDFVSTVVTPIQHMSELADPNRVKVKIDSSNCAEWFCRELPEHQKEIMYNHIGLYGYRRSTLQRYVTLPVPESESEQRLEQLRFLSNGIPVYCGVCKEATVAVDTPEDLERVRKILSVSVTEPRQITPEAIN